MTVLHKPIRPAAIARDLTLRRDKHGVLYLGDSPLRVGQRVEVLAGEVFYPGEIATHRQRFKVRLASGRLIAGHGMKARLLSA
jgi:hypothetical protein